MTGDLERDASRSTDGWVQRDDGKWYKTDYYKLHEEKGEEGIEVMERFFVGSYKVAQNVQWVRSKSITRILSLGTFQYSGLEGILLRAMDVDEDNIFDYFDNSVALIREALQEHEAVLVVDRDGMTFCPVIVIAYLMAVMGWSLQMSIERIQQIFNIHISGFSLYVLERWEKVIIERKSQVTVERKVLASQAAPEETIEVAEAEAAEEYVAPIIVAPPQPMIYPSSYYYVESPPIVVPPTPIVAPPVYSYSYSMPSVPSYSIPSSYSYSLPSAYSYSSYMPQASYSNYYNYSQPAYQAYTQPAYYSQPAYVAPQPMYVPQPSFSYGVAAQEQQAQAGQNARAVQVQKTSGGGVVQVQTTTTRNTQLVMGSASWHSGGVRVSAQR
jgi:hypothetical protein